MIDKVKKKLTSILFTSLGLFILITLCITYLFIEYSIRKTALTHLQLNYEVEFLPHYKKRDFNTLRKIIEDELFQVFDEDGTKILSVQSHVEYNPAINVSLLRQVLIEKENRYEFVRHKGDAYLLYYIPIGDGKVCRIICSMEARYEIRKGYLGTMLISLPLLLIFSFFLTRLLVRESLKPIHRVFTFQETFSSNLTHELNSPLTSIKGTLEVMLRKERTRNDYREGLKSILRSINRIIVLLNNLYFLSIAEQRNLQLAVNSIDLTRLVSEVVEKLEPNIFAKKIHLEMELESSAHCQGDLTLLGRAIENIVENAVKYTPENGSITLRVTKNTVHYIFMVSNTCNGITQADLKELYRPFYRLKCSADKYVKGVGLGLFIVKFIVEAHQGKIESQLDGNTITFSIFLPIGKMEKS